MRISIHFTFTRFTTGSFYVTAPTCAVNVFFPTRTRRCGGQVLGRAEIEPSILAGLSNDDDPLELTVDLYVLPFMVTHRLLIRAWSGRYLCTCISLY